MNSDIPVQTVANIPSELSGPVPRTIQTTYSTGVLQLGLRFLLAAAVLLILWYGKHVVVEMQHRSALRQDGVDSQGEITYLDRPGKGSYIIRYTFPANGKTVSDKAEVPAELVRSLGASPTTTIRYLPYDPSINHPAAWEWSFLSEWPLYIVIAGPFMIWAATFREIRKSRKLLTWGKPVSGVVTNCRVSGRGAISIQYEFRTEAGETMTGSGGFEKQREIGEGVVVLYLPQNPRRNCPYSVTDFYIEE